MDTTEIRHLIRRGSQWTRKTEHGNEFPDEVIITAYTEEFLFYIPNPATPAEARFGFSARVEHFVLHMVPISA